MPSDEFTIFPPHAAFYTTSLLFCTESAYASTRSLAKLFEEQGEGPYSFALQPALNQLQKLVLQGASISRFLWPTGAKYKKRGEALRKALDLEP